VTKETVDFFTSKIIHKYPVFLNDTLRLWHGKG